jgi:hypothetical protein
MVPGCLKRMKFADDFCNKKRQIEKEEHVFPTKQHQDGVIQVEIRQRVDCARRFSFISGEYILSEERYLE